MKAILSGDFMLAAFLPLALTVSCFALLGAAIGLACYKSISLQVTVSMVLSLLAFVVIQFKAGTLSLKASLLSNLLGSAVYLVAPFVMFCLFPALAASILVGRLRNRKRHHDGTK